MFKSFNTWGWGLLMVTATLTLCSPTILPAALAASIAASTPEVEPASTVWHILPPSRLWQLTSSTCAALSA